jgi:hypothetical protein
MWISSAASDAKRSLHGVALVDLDLLHAAGGVDAVLELDRLEGRARRRLGVAGHVSVGRRGHRPRLGRRGRLRLRRGLGLRAGGVVAAGALGDHDADDEHDRGGEEDGDAGSGGHVVAG